MEPNHINTEGLEILSNEECKKTNGGAISLLAAGVILGFCLVVGFIKGYTDNISSKTE
jgi:hypothetical protein